MLLLKNVKKHSDHVIRRSKWLLKSLGPGLVSGAADDDPSGIATYSQAGAQFGLGMLWTSLFTLPLMIAIQVVSARIGCASSKGVAANIRDHYPRIVVLLIVLSLLIANTFNLGADLAAMSAATQLIIGGNYHVYVIAFAALSLGLLVFLPFPVYSPILKILTLPLLSYVAILFAVDIPWSQTFKKAVWPQLSWNSDYILTIVAVFGTTISPYLFFWQAAQEAEEQKLATNSVPRTITSEHVTAHLKRIKIDTYLGMTFSNLIAFFIILTTAVTLHTHGITNIQTTKDAAEALRPIAGKFAFTLFSLGIIGTGLLAIPVLAGSAAYAVAEGLGWPTGLALKPKAAKGFYGILIVSTLIGILLDLNNVDPIKELYWSAIINGVVAVPIMAMMMLLARRKDIMGPFVAKLRLKVLGWISVLIMAGLVILMIVTTLR